MFDPINPAHYIEGRTFEVIDVIEDNISRAPDTMAGFYQGQALKYLCRLWDKGNAIENVNKAKWYLDKLVGHQYVAELTEKADSESRAFTEIPETILGGSDEFVPFDSSPSTYEEVCRLARRQADWPEDEMVDTAPSEYEAYFG